MTHEDSSVTDVLGRALQDERPQKRARDLVHVHGRRKSIWRVLPLVAAGLILILVVSSLTVPVVARALGEAPILGDSYLRFLTGTGMDLAYQAGLVNELNRSDTQGDFTLTVLAAYADATQGLIVFQISSHDPGRIEDLWHEPHTIFPEIHRALGADRVSASGSMEYIPEEGIIYGIIDTNPLAWSIFGQRLTAEVKALGLSVTFPLQTIPSELNEKVKVNKSFVYEELEFTINELVFSPSATQVSYTFTSADKGPGKGDKSWIISLRDADGNEYNSLTGNELDFEPLGRTSGAGTGTGVMNYLPIDSPEISVLFLGYETMYQHQASLSLEAGSSTVTPGGGLTIAEVVSTAASTQVSLVWSGTGRLVKPSIQLVDSLGNRSWVTDAQPTAEGLTLAFEHGELVGPVDVVIDAVLIRVQEEIEVAKIIRGK